MRSVWHETAACARAQVRRGHLELSLERTIARRLFPRDDRLAQRAARSEHAERVGEHAELAARHLPPHGGKRRQWWITAAAARMTSDHGRCSARAYKRDTVIPMIIARGGTGNHPAIVMQ